MTASHPRATPKEWGGLAVLALPTMLLGLDVTVLYLVLPELAADLRPSSTQALWIMDVYGFLIAGFLITMGTLGDRIGRRKLLLIGAAAFGAASLLAAFATSAALLIAARAALGIAGATLMPSTLALLSNMFTNPQQRAVAIGVWATMFALGMAAGPIVGGLLLRWFWWGSAFLVAIPIVAIVLMTAPRLLPEYRDAQADQLDLWSVALSLTAVLPIVYAVKRFAAAGAELPVLISLLIATTSAVLFVRRQRRLSNPLLDIRLFTHRSFSAALTILLIGLVGVSGVMYLVTQYLQLVAEQSALRAGLWMGPAALAMLIAAIGAPLLSRRIRPAIVLSGALGLSTIGYLLLTFITATSPIPVLISGFALVYLGLGALAALGTDLVVAAAPASRAGSAAAMSETAQELGVAVGVAGLGSLSVSVYQAEMAGRIPSHLSPDVRAGLADSLSQATAAPASPEYLLWHAKDAFAAGVNTVALAAGIAVALLVVLSIISLRHVPTLSGDDAASPSEVSSPSTVPAPPAP